RRPYPICDELCGGAPALAYDHSYYFGRDVHADPVAAHAERFAEGIKTMTLTRREFVQLAAALGASLAWGGPARASATGWHERRDLYPEGVASGDPDPASVILWTRRPFEAGGRQVL